MTVSQQTHVSNESAHSSNRFYVSCEAFSFHRQYSKIYTARLAAAKPILFNAVSKYWNGVNLEHPLPPQIPIRSLNSLVNNERCVIVGTVYKEMKKKPSILRELAASETMRSLVESGASVSCSDRSQKLFSPEDQVFLEDDVQRILLVFDKNCATKSVVLSAASVITGVVVALLGFEPESELGSFHVEDVVFLEPQPERPITAFPYSGDSSANPKDCAHFRSSGPWLALVSGLEFSGTGPTRPGHAMALQLLADWLRCSGDWTDSLQTGLGVVRLMIVGDSITGPDSGSAHGSFVQQARYLTRNTEADSVTAMIRFDSWLATLPLGPGPAAPVAGRTESNGFLVDLLPGPSDPTSSLLPQQPVHAAAFPRSERSGLYGRTNPFLCELFGRTVLATSGQGVNDLQFYTDIEDSCDRMEATLLWGHLAPSCPDTLPGYPLSAEDLLLFKMDRNTRRSPDYPDIYVVGCQSGTEPSWRRASLRWKNRKSDHPSDHGGALLISVPRFSISRSLVLVHLETLDCRVVHFDTSALDDSENA